MSFLRLRFLLPALLGLAVTLALVLSRPGSANEEAEGGPRIDGVDVHAGVFDAAAEGIATPHRFDRRVTIHGAGFYGTSFGPYVRIELSSGDVIESPLVVLHDDETVEAALPESAHGPCRIVVENPDHASVSFAVEL